MSRKCLKENERVVRRRKRRHRGLSSLQIELDHSIIERN